MSADERTELMTITVHRTPGSPYCEVGFTDIEDSEVKAFSGLLDAEERAELAARLRQVAKELEAA